jgi:hypothetical protein
MPMRFRIKGDADAECIRYAYPCFNHEENPDCNMLTLSMLFEVPRSHVVLRSTDFPRGTQKRQRRVPSIPLGSNANCLRSNSSRSLVSTSQPPYPTSCRNFKGHRSTQHELGQLTPHDNSVSCVEHQHEINSEHIGRKQFVGVRRGWPQPSWLAHFG